VGRREAARLLSISERKLWSLTVSGEIPAAKIGTRVVYPVEQLRAWLEARTKGGAMNTRKLFLKGAMS